MQKSQDRGKEDFSKSVDAFNWSFIKFGGSVFISELWSLEKSISYSLQCWNFCWSSSPLGFCSLRAAGTAQGGLSQPPHCACDIRCVGHNQNTWEVTEISNTCLLLYLLIISIMVFIFFNDAFWKKIFPWIKSDIFERKLGGEKKKNQQTDFAVGYHNKYATFSPNARRLHEGLKQGPFISSQHSSLLTELMG